MTPFKREFKPKPNQTVMDLKLGVGALIKKLGWLKVMRMALMIVLSAVGITCLIVLYDNFLQHKFGSESLWPAVGLSSLVVFMYIFRRFSPTPGVQVEGSVLTINGERMERGWLVGLKEVDGTHCEIVFRRKAGGSERTVRLDLANYEENDQPKIFSAVKEWARRSTQ